MQMVKMYHYDPSVTAGPTTADVPKESIHEWEKSGWSTMPFGKKPKAGAFHTMYRIDPDSSIEVSASVPEASVHIWEREGWSLVPFS